MRSPSWLYPAITRWVKPSRRVDRLFHHSQEVPAPYLVYLVLGESVLEHAARQDHELRHLGHHKRFIEAVEIGPDTEVIDAAGWKNNDSFLS